jgi:hypothetical protein
LTNYTTRNYATSFRASLPLDFEQERLLVVDGGAATTIANRIKLESTLQLLLPNGKGAGAQWAGSKLKMASPVDFSTKNI